MNAFKAIVAICCLALTVKAKPGIGHTKLEGIPDGQTYGAISYPRYEIIDLGEYSKGFVPGDEIHVNKHETITVPQPYPVKIPIPQPYPVHISKPYPVVETKYIKVPHAVPYEVVKHVPVPVEVPKPYPVPANEHSHHGDSYGAGSSKVQGLYEPQNGAGNYGIAQQNANYETQEFNQDEAINEEEANGVQQTQDWQPSEQDQH